MPTFIPPTKKDLFDRVNTSLIYLVKRLQRFFDFKLLNTWQSYKFVFFNCRLQKCNIASKQETDKRYSSMLVQ